jgi:hypothetical protein
VNDLISSLRKSTVSSQSTPPTTSTARTLPPEIRHLLAEPETPAPRPRARRRVDENGRRIPPGPRAPQSWSERSRQVTVELKTGRTHVYPTDIEHLPGLPSRECNGMKLQDMCLRNIARNWEFMRGYEKYNLIFLPSTLRSLLLSNIAVYGPDGGVGYEGLKNLLVPPPIDSDAGTPENEDLEDREISSGGSLFDTATHNEGFFRLDLSGAMGKSVSFRQLIELIEKPETPPESDANLSWEERMSLSTSLSAPIPILTHLSLSHPATSISWPRLLSFVKLVPTLTHLSLAFWPVPSLTPNAKTTVMQDNLGRDVQYGGTNYYSHSLDNDFREAAEVLRRLALSLYGLEYLDLSGCTDWLRALRWTGEGNNDRGLDWSSQWTKLVTLKVYSGVDLTTESEYAEVVRFVQSYREALAIEDMLRWWIRRSKATGRRSNWIDVVKDDWMAYGELWIGRTDANQEELKRKRNALDSLKRKNTTGEEQWRSLIVFEMDEQASEEVAQRLNVWEQ